VKYFDEINKLQSQTADLVVVACSAIESARLLLNSNSKLHPNGAGNNHDCVGRNLQSHAYVSALGLFDFDILDLTGPGATMAICDFNHHNEGIIGGGLLANEFFQMPYVFSRSHPWGAKWGKEHKDFQRDNYRRIGRLMGPIQEIPMFDSRVTVDDEVKDFWGIPVAALSGHRNPLDIKSAGFLVSKAEEIIKEAGAIKTWKWSLGDVGNSPSCGSHQAGTCRMGNDPKTSVVNAHCRVHEIDNLFVAGGSTLVTNGGFNPALTILATSFRTGEYIAKNFNSIKKISL
jgi:choline dehydrogenase-like flavoprotein